MMDAVGNPGACGAAAAEHRNGVQIPGEHVAVMAERPLTYACCCGRLPLVVIFYREGEGCASDA